MEQNRTWKSYIGRLPLFSITIQITVFDITDLRSAISYHLFRAVIYLLLALEQTGGDKADLGADLLTRKLEPIGRIGGIVIVQPFTLGVCTGQTHVVIEISDTVNGGST